MGSLACIFFFDQFVEVMIVQHILLGPGDVYRPVVGKEKNELIHELDMGMCILLDSCKILQ